jgi:hypothetical protein
MVGAEQRTDCGSLRLPSLAEIALSGAIFKPVTRWITDARRISMSHQRDRLTGAKSSPCRSRVRERRRGGQYKKD